jgi:hypothetical protein
MVGLAVMEAPAVAFVVALVFVGLSEGAVGLAEAETETDETDVDLQTPVVSQPFEAFPSQLEKPVAPEGSEKKEGWAAQPPFGPLVSMPQVAPPPAGPWQTKAATFAMPCAEQLRPH